MGGNNKNSIRARELHPNAMRRSREMGMAWDRG